MEIPATTTRGARWLSVLVLLSTLPLGAAAPTLRWVSEEENPYRPRVEAAPVGDGVVPEDLTVRVASPPGKPPLPAMAGTRSLTEGVLQFHPRFPLTPGLRYVATLESGGATISTAFTAPPRAAQPPAVVTKVTPTADALPLNLLKFYLHFSAPMARGGAYQHISLRDHTGKLVEDPFLELPEELWNREMTRLTVLLDPGRIKRGLLPNESVGAVMEAGKDYTLTIARSWKDASGQLLEKPFLKTFRATAPDYTQPDPEKWRYEYPLAGTREPLRITFAESLDNALATRLIDVRRVSGESLPGRVTLTDRERRWEFHPEQAWLAAPHDLHFDHRIEDLAGNSIERRFEEALDQHPEAAGSPAPHSRVRFTPRPAPSEK